MKRFSLSLLLLFLLLSISQPSNAATSWSDTTNGFTYTVISSANKTVGIKKNGSTLSSKTSITIPETAKNGSTTYTVIRVDASGFASLTSLQTVSLPATVTTLNESAFSGCTKLKTIDLSHVNTVGKTAFKGCTALTTVNLSEAKSVGVSSFSGCTGLMTVTCGESLSKIDESAFSGCNKLSSIDLSHVSTIGKTAFKGCTALTSVDFSAATSIGESAFDGCTGLKSIEIPQGTVGKTAFANCSKLETASLGAGITSLGASMFSACVKLTRLDIYTPTINAAILLGNTGSTSVYLHEGVTSIGGYFAGSNTGTLVHLSIPSTVTSITGTSAGWGLYNCKATTLEIGAKTLGATCARACPNLTTLTLTNGASTIGKQTFLNCTKLTTINIEAPGLRIGEEAFSGCSAINTINVNADSVSFGTKSFFNLAALTSVNISGKGISVGESSFSQCASLKTIKLSEVITIGKSAFSQCSVLNNIGNLSEVTTIGDYAFQSCTALTSTGDMPKLVTIGQYAFDGCSKLATVGDMPLLTTIGQYAFQNCTALTRISDVPELTEIGASAFNGCTNLTGIGSVDKLAYIRASAFEGCTKLAGTIDLPSCRNIGTSAFKNCSALQSIDIASGVINYSAFLNCSSLTSVVLGAGITSIGNNRGKNYAFTGCTSLNRMDIYIPEIINRILPNDGTNSTNIEVYLHEGVKKISTLFNGADTGIKYINIPSSVDTLMASALANCPAVTMDVAAKVLREKCMLNCANLTTLSLKETVDSIGNSAFQNCAVLKTVDNLSSVRIIPNLAFDACSALESIDLSNIDSIGTSAFRNDVKLQDIGSPAHIRAIGAQAFYNCESLTSIGTLSTVTRIGNRAFSGCGALEGVGNLSAVIYGIGDEAFSGCTTALQSVNISSGTIGKSAFAGCETLEYAYLGKDITSLGTQLFSGCSSLARLDIATPVINTPILYNCTGKTSVYCLDGVKDIGTVFANKNSLGNEINRATGLEYLYVPTSVDSLRSYALCGSSATAMDIGAKVIKGYAIYECPNLEFLSLEEGVTTLEGDFSIAHNRKQRIINMPNTLSTIGGHFLCTCPLLEEVTLPAAVTNILGQFFHGCEGLRKVYLLGGKNDMSELADEGAFTQVNGCKHVNNCVFYVKDEATYQKYLSHPVWSKVDANNAYNLKGTGSSGDFPSSDGGYRNSYNFTTGFISARDFTAGKWSTAYFPFGVTDYQSVFGTGTQVVKLVGATVSRDATTETNLYRMQFQQVTDRNLEANVPYLIKVPANVTVDMTQGGTMTEEMWTADIHRDITVSNEPTSTVIMVGKALPYYLSKAEFYMKDANIYKAAASGKTKIDDFKCFFRILKEGAPITNAKYADFEFEDMPEPTGITEITVSDEMEDLFNTSTEKEGANGWYTLQGMKIEVNDENALSKGLYIHNGKKVIIK